jgi:hypothetical protein
LLRDKVIEVTDKETVTISNELFIETIEEMLVLFKKHPTRPVFKDWLKEKELL